MIKRVILTGIILGFLLPLMAQEEEVELEKYEMGRGLRFDASSGAQYRISGYLQPFVEYKKGHYSNPSTEVRFRMRRIRLRLEGKAANPKFSYRLQTDMSGTGEELEGNSNFLLDAFVAYDLHKNTKITVGQRASYTDNRELFMNSNSLQLVERSRLTSAFATIREFGIFIDGSYRLSANQYIKPYLVLSNGDGANVWQKDRGGMKLGGRLDYLPFGLFTRFGQFNQVDIVRELTPKLVIGATYSYNQGVSSRRGRESGSILYLDNNNRELLPDFSKFGIDFLFKYRGFSVLGEFVKTQAYVPDGISQRVRVDGSNSSSFDVNGSQNIPDYIKGRMMLGSAYNIQMGYLFNNRISLDARLTHLKADVHSFLNNGTFYNRPRYYTVGISKMFGRNYGTKVQADYTFIVNNGGINNSKGIPTSGNESVLRFIMSYAF